MYRYVAIAWVAGDSAASDAAARLSARLLGGATAWETVYRSAGLCVHQTGAGTNRAYSLPGNGGVVLGKLFARSDAESPTPVIELGGKDADDICRTGGQVLVDQFWGRYVAFLYDNACGVTQVLRDPTGTLPCFRTPRGNLSIFFARTEDVLALGIPAFSINWDYVAAQLVLYAMECRETALAEVTQVLGGERVQASDMRCEWVWKPHRIASDHIEEPSSAAAELRRAVRSCVTSWAGSYERSILRLSGGLDSSIVASCLASRHGAFGVVCLNYFSRGADTDERHYARFTASTCGLPLMEQERPAQVRLELLRQMAHTPKPTFYADYAGYSRMEALLAREQGAKAVLTGTGGDQLFYQSPSVWPAVDHLWDHGLGLSTVSVALDVARLARRSWWHVIGQMAGSRLPWTRPKKSVGIADYTTLPSNDVMVQAARTTRFQHPWQTSADGTPLGKHRQLVGLLVPVEYHDPLMQEGDPEHVHPLLSQPVVETCLRIPTYVLTNGGWDRALARQAFSADLPPQVARRRSKGSVGDHYHAILSSNLPLIRSSLLDGALAARGLLDRNRLSQVLSGQPTRIGSTAAELLTYFGIEMWLQKWNEASRRAAA